MQEHEGYVSNYGVRLFRDTDGAVAKVTLRILNRDGSYGALGDNVNEVRDTAGKGDCGWVSPLEATIPARLAMAYAIEITNLGVGGDPQKAGVIKIEGLE
jgi:hypothetical protein